MFEGEKNGAREERGSLLSFSRGAGSAPHELRLGQTEDAQERHRLARARREARRAPSFATQMADEPSVTVVPSAPEEEPSPVGEPAASSGEPAASSARPSQNPDAPSSASHLSSLLHRWRNGDRSDVVNQAEVAPTTTPGLEARGTEDGRFAGGRRNEDRRAVQPPRSEIWTPLIDPIKVIGRVFDSKLLIASTTLVGALLGVAIALSTPKKYEALTELLVDPRALKLSERDLTEQGLPSDATLAIVESQVRVLTSGTVLSKVVDELNLAADPEFNGQRRAFGIRALIGELRSILSRDGGEAAGADHRTMIAIETLAQALSVERGGKTFVITIGAATESPEKSALIANTMAEVFLETYGQIQSQTAGRAADELTSRLDELRKGVEDAERKVAAFKAENDIIDPQGRLITDDEIVRLNEQLSTARARTLELNARAASVRGVDVDSVVGGAIPESINSSIITELRSQYAALKNESDRMGVRLGPRHPERQAAEAQLAGAREQIAAELRRIASSVQVEMKRAVELEQQLAQRLAQLKVRQGDLSGELVQLRELEREASAKRAVYESFLLRARETGEQRDINTANMSVISKAYPPLDPTGPSRSTIALTGAFLGFAAGVGLAMMRGAFDSLRDRKRDAQRRPHVSAPPPWDPDGGASRERRRNLADGATADTFAPPSSTAEASLARDRASSTETSAPRAQEPDTSSEEDSSMLRHPADTYYQPAPGQFHAHGWQSQPNLAHPEPVQPYGSFAPLPPHTHRSQAAPYAVPGAPYAHQAAHSQPAAYYPPSSPNLQPPAAYATVQPYYPYPQQQDPRAWYGQAPAPHPAHVVPATAPAAHPYAAPETQQAMYARQTASPVVRPVAETVPFPGRNVQASDSPQPSSQTLTDRDTSSAIADIRASVAEFREAVREFTESRQKRRFF